jgi:hypothetical protein
VARWLTNKEMSTKPFCARPVFGYPSRNAGTQARLNNIRQQQCCLDDRRYAYSFNDPCCMLLVTREVGRSVSNLLFSCKKPKMQV